MWDRIKTRRGAGDCLVKLLTRRPRAIVDTITYVKIITRVKIPSRVLNEELLVDERCDFTREAWKGPKVS